MTEQEPLSFKDILASKKPTKAPAYLWQDLALKIERELRIPAFKRSAVFKVCRDYPRQVIERCLADTKELCQTGEQWRYFFKAVTQSSNPDENLAQDARRRMVLRNSKPLPPR